MRAAWIATLCLALSPVFASAASPKPLDAGSAPRAGGFAPGFACDAEHGVPEEMAGSEVPVSANSGTSRHFRNGSVFSSRFASAAASGLYPLTPGDVSARLRAPVRPSARSRMSEGFTEYNRPR